MGTYLLELVLDLCSRISVATLYEFKIIIDVPKALTWIISESAQSIRWILSVDSESQSITNYILFPTSQTSPIRVSWALKEGFQSEGTFWAQEEDFVLDVGHSSNARQWQSECSEQGRAEWASSVKKCWTKSSKSMIINHIIPSLNLTWWKEILVT